MQKHIQTKVFSFILGITFLLVPELANAGIISLPRYTGEFAYRTNSGGRDQTCSASYKYTCSGTGYSGGSGTACGDKYQSCVCAANYKWSGSSCTLKTCSDYGYSASKDATKSCEEKTPRSGLTCYACTSCNSTTYKYSCSGGLNATNQSGTACNSLYSECACVDNASWNSSTGKCECGSDYKAGSTSCTLKTCDDYGYSATENKTKNCSKQTPRSGLECWSCSDCSGTLYDCGSITNASGGSGTACGGKYPSCSCKSLYRWDNGSCVLNCTRNSCSTTTYPLTAQNAANASSYEKCTPSCSDESPRYKVASCASGYNVKSNGSGCEAVPTKTCAEWLVEEGYTLVTTKAELETAVNGDSEEIVVMNDISDIDGYDSPINKSIYAPAYFHDQYSNCSGVTTLKYYDAVQVEVSANQTLDIYVNLDCNDISDKSIGEGSKINFYENIYISSMSGLYLPGADVAVYGKKVYVGDGYVKAKTFTVSENTSFYMGYQDWVEAKLIIKKGAVLGQITYDGYHYKIKALSDLMYEEGRYTSNLPYNCSERGNTSNYGMWKCSGSIEGHCYNDYKQTTDTYSDEVNLALCHYCGDADAPSYPSYCNYYKSCKWVTTLNSTGHCVGTTGSYIRCAPEGTTVEGYKNIGDETIGGEDMCGNDTASLSFTPVQKCYNACTDDRGFDYDVTRAWMQMNNVKDSFDSENGYIAYCRDVLNGGEGSWGEGNYEFYYNGTRYTTSENAMSTCKCLRACNDKDYKYPSYY